MTDEHHAEEPSSDAGDLQFDQAEYETPEAAEPTCTACKNPIEETYYEANGAMVCASCRESIEAAMTGGSRLGRFVKATIFGAIAALVGFLIYYGVMKITGYELALISILVGLLVGGAVPRARGIGGAGFIRRWRSS